MQEIINALRANLESALKNPMYALGQARTLVDGALSIIQAHENELSLLRERVEGLENARSCKEMGGADAMRVLSDSGATNPD